MANALDDWDADQDLPEELVEMDDAVLTAEEREWLRGKLHTGDCRQCSLVARLLDALQSKEK